MLKILELSARANSDWQDARQRSKDWSHAPAGHALQQGPHAAEEAQLYPDEHSHSGYYYLKLVDRVAAPHDYEGLKKIVQTFSRR